MNTDEQSRIYHSIREYCDKYNIPIEGLLDILEDQKVLPMIRGKATEYIAAIVLKQTLNPREWHELVPYIGVGKQVTGENRTSSNLR